MGPWAKKDIRLKYQNNINLNSNLMMMTAACFNSTYSLPSLSFTKLRNEVFPAWRSTKILWEFAFPVLFHFKIRNPKICCQQFQNSSFIATVYNLLLYTYSVVLYFVIEDHATCFPCVGVLFILILRLPFHSSIYIHANYFPASFCLFL